VALKSLSVVGFLLCFLKLAYLILILIFFFNLASLFLIQFCFSFLRSQLIVVIVIVDGIILIDGTFDAVLWLQNSRIFVIDLNVEDDDLIVVVQVIIGVVEFVLL